MGKETARNKQVGKGRAQGINEWAREGWGINKCAKGGHGIIKRAKRGQRRNNLAGWVGREGTGNRNRQGITDG